MAYMYSCTELYCKADYNSTVDTIRNFLLYP